MSEPCIVNIINFIRGVEPRDPALDLLEPVEQQIALVQSHQLAATWLVQYDAMIDPRFRELLLDGLDESQEVGLWLEIVQPLVEKAGLPWRGRFPWDWHADVGFSIGYTPQERERLVDVCMEDFRAIFGDYPHSVGSWLLDAHTLQYLAERYGVCGACICRDQWGTDGYTLWGGYFNQAYYPSRMNAYMPAQRAEHQIPIPVFRMLGSDPIYQYSMGHPGEAQGVTTLEPVYKEGGGSPPWVRWFFDLSCGGPNLSFGYMQVGQENSFGWPAMAAGLTDQIEEVARRAQCGEMWVETLDASAAWYRAQYPVTPASAVTALTDWKGEGKRSVWYGSRYYRANLFWEGDSFRVRDLHLFDERYPERYLTERCDTADCTYDTLPVVEGFLWSDTETQAGLTPVMLLPDGSLEPWTGQEPAITEEDADTLLVNWPSTGTLTMRLTPTALSFQSTAPAWGLRLGWGQSVQPPITGLSETAIQYEYRSFRYQVACTRGSLRTLEDGGILLLPQDGQVTLSFTPDA